MKLLHGRFHRQFHDHDAKIAFGLDPKAKWPAEGMPARDIQGVRMYVAPLGQDRGFRLRAICDCPVCGKRMAIGRLNQHAKIHE